VAAAALPSIPLLLFDQPLGPFSAFTPYVQQQISKVLRAYAQRVGTEIAGRMAVKF